MLFNKNANAFISFVEENKAIRGFETINYKEFDPSKLVEYVD